MSMKFSFACLFLLVAACQGKSVGNLKAGVKQNVGSGQDSGTKKKGCQENANKLKPRSCVDHLKNGADNCGYYKIYDAAGNGFTVYCDMETEPGAAWTLIMSWSLKNKLFSNFRQTPMSINDPVNENSPNWFLYRLTMDRMKSLRDVSTHWRATCSYDKYGINNYKDYVRGKFADADIFAFLGHGVCLKTELVNIRGHTGIHKTAGFWQVAGSYLGHMSTEHKCQFDYSVGQVSSEDNFGFYSSTNPKFTCTMNGDSTTQWWFGSYQ
ncbi:uncharacterized protein [Porites lutea]|uniref:uncharacterized protein n=1 Tax=Porites lutea TaxID=51062 RepID=UPI003CC5C77A